MVGHGIEVACEDNAGGVFFSYVGLCCCPCFYLGELVESDEFTVWSPCEMSVDEGVGVLVWCNEVGDGCWVGKIVCFL